MRPLVLTIFTLVCGSIVATAQDTVTVVGRDPYSFADVPQPFRFLFRGSIPSRGLSEAWAALPFDSITLQRSSCLGTCPAYAVTFYRGTAKPASNDSTDDQFGRAVLTVTRATRAQRGVRTFLEARSRRSSVCPDQEFRRPYTIMAAFER
jgi:hypothetical protein